MANGNKSPVWIGHCIICRQPTTEALKGPWRLWQETNQKYMHHSWQVWRNSKIWISCQQNSTLILSSFLIWQEYITTRIEVKFCLKRAKWRSQSFSWCESTWSSCYCPPPVHTLPMLLSFLTSIRIGTLASVLVLYEILVSRHYR